MKTAILVNVESFDLDRLQLPINDSVNTLIARGSNLQIGDGYHTMAELYRHRYELFLALMKIYDSYITPLGCRVYCWKSKLHDDGTMFEGCFIAGMTLRSVDFHGTQITKYITYHLPSEYWGLCKVSELIKAPPYDGHTSEDVIRNLRDL